MDISLLIYLNLRCISAYIYPVFHSLDHSHTNKPIQVEYGGECHISGRPYTVFRWRPGNDARYKKTIICQEVAKAKNVCQVCLLDLDYNLPVQVRDKALGLQDEDLPESVTGREFALKNMELTGQLDDRSKFNTSGANQLLDNLKRTEPYYKRNQAKICTFFIRGECKRGAECPYRHEMPDTGPLSQQNIRDRYHGTNDPVASKMLARASEMQQLTPPADRSIMTLFVGGVGTSISEEDLRDAFYPHGEIKSVKKVDNRNCAFVTYTSREGAERAAKSLGNGRLNIKGERLKVLWGKPQAPKGKQGGGAGGESYFELPKGSNQAAQMYAAMDPMQAGTSGGGGKREREQGGGRIEEKKAGGDDEKNAKKGKFDG